MTDRQLTNRIFKLALPVILGSMGYLLFDLIDIFWISYLGTEAVAGLASAGFLDGVMAGLMGMTYTGCATLVSHAIGEKNTEKKLAVVRESFQLSMLISMGLLILFLVFGPASLKWMGLKGAAFDFAWSFFKVIVWGLPITYTFIICGQIFMAHGDTHISTLTMMLGLGMNAILDPFFIFGWGPFPAWKAFGAGVATMISFAIALLFRLYILRKKNYIGDFKSFVTVFTKKYFIKILNVGIPSASARVVWSSVYPMLSTLITLFGMAPLAGLTVAHRIEGIAYFVAVGFSTAVATLVGQSVGRKEYDFAKRIAYHARFLITAILVPISLLFLFVPELLLRFGTNDPAVLAHGASYLRAIGVFEILLGWELIFEGGFNGLGQTRPYMMISVPFTLGRYPLAYAAIHYWGFGVSAVWWSISISTALKGILLNWRFRYSKLFLATAEKKNK